MKYFYVASFLWLIFLPSQLYAQSDEITVAQFSQKAAGADLLMEDWLIFDFKNTPHTDYEVVDLGDRTVVKATSKNSASGLIMPVDIDPMEYPIMEWSWRVDDLVEDADITQRSGDDYAARIYITFDIPLDSLSYTNRLLYLTASKFYKEGRIPARAMNYIWANKAAVGEVHPNPWTDLSMLQVVESGDEKLGIWVTEKQNVLEDYRNIFKSDPPKINSIAIMTDTDNTEGTARAFYGDIVFKKE